MIAYNRFLIITAAVFLPAAASAASLTQEPDSPFSKGKDVEWTESHVGGTDVPLEMHREYHRNAQGRHSSWHADHTDMDHASGEYIRMHRLYHQEMNEAHRKFHRGLTDEDEGFVPGSAWEQSGWSVIEDDGAVTRPVTAGRPSRRTLREQTLQLIEDARNGR